MEKFVECGSFALRRPNGEFMPSVPLYIQAKDAGQVNERTGLTVAEELTLIDVGKVFADKFKQYADGVKAEERKRKGGGKK